MIQEYQIRTLPQDAANEQSIKQFISHEKGLDIRTIKAIRILKRSIDARHRTIFINLQVRVFINEQPEDDEFKHTEYPNVEGKPGVIVVGAGPGGLFAALRLIELGLCPVVIERGKNVRERKSDLALISRNQKIDPESNYSFGEGGAGAYSDGKLYTRSKKRGNVDKILNVFCQHGASTNILMDAHPHIGTDKLPRVIENMRNTILNCGGEVHFQTRMEGLIIKKNKIIGIETNTGKTFYGPVILATGHSARDVYRWLFAHCVPIEAKGIAVKLFIVGLKGTSVLKRRAQSAGFEIVKTYTKISQEPNSSNALVIAEDMAAAFVNGDIDSIEIVTTRFKNMMSYKVEDWKILPADDIKKALGDEDEQPSAGIDPLMAFEPNADNILQKIVPMFITNIIYQALLEAVASELAARMTAMSAATNNAEEMIRILSIDYNKARQAAITNEILEVVSGADALKK